GAWRDRFLPGEAGDQGSGGAGLGGHVPVGERAAATDPQQQAAVGTGRQGALFAPAGEPPLAAVACRDEREGASGDGQGQAVAVGAVEAGGQEGAVQRGGRVEVREPAGQEGVVRQRGGPRGRGGRGGA